MVILRTTLRVAGLRAGEVVDFLLRCTDTEYRRWWPGTHLSFHTVERRPGELGNVVFMDEWIGDRRVRMKGVLNEWIPEQKLVWQLKLGVRQPVRLLLELQDEPEGVRITHTIQAGFAGIGRIFDPLLRLYFSKRFVRAMDEHVRTEFPKLAALLRGAEAAASSTA